MLTYNFSSHRYHTGSRWGFYEWGLNWRLRGFYEEVM
jgi:hypothetical protein